MFTHFVDLPLHLDSVTVVVGYARVVLRVFIGYLHISLSVFVRAGSYSRANLVSTDLVDGLVIHEFSC